MVCYCVHKSLALESILTKVSGIISFHLQLGMLYGLSPFKYVCFALLSHIHDYAEKCPECVVTCILSSDHTGAWNESVRKDLASSSFSDILMRVEQDTDSDLVKLWDVIMTVTFLQLLKFVKLWCQHMHPERAFKRHWMLYATQPLVCPIQRKTKRCVSFWKHCFLQTSQGARRFLLDPVCLALPFLIVIWISFLIQVVVLLQHANGHSPLFSTEINTV